MHRPCTLGSSFLDGSDAECAATQGNDTMMMARDPGRSLRYAIKGGTVTVVCPPTHPPTHTQASQLSTSSDRAACFLYGPHGLPAPPAIANCTPPSMVESHCARDLPPGFQILLSDAP